MVIKTLAARLFCSWKPDSSALFMDLLIFQRCKYFGSILKKISYSLFIAYSFRCSWKLCKIYRKTPALKRSLFFKKITGLRHTTLSKERLWYRCFPVNIMKFSRTPFLQKNCREIASAFLFELLFPIDYFLWRASD